MNDEPAPSDGAPRRSFLIGLGAVVAGALAGLTPLVAGVVALFDPLRRTGGEAGFVRVTRLGALPADGVPRRFTIQADLVDAWTTYTDTPVGAVYLRRTEDDGVLALNVVCPHAGCFVNLAPDRGRFACPCHRSSFALDGSINDPASPSPRDMDELEVEVRDGDEVWVRFQNFMPGREEKLPIA